MTHDEARELARRWSFHRDPPRLLGVKVGALLDPDGALNEEEREQLFAWVRERMTLKVKERVANSVSIGARRNSTGPMCRDDGLSPSDREALALAVSEALDLTEWESMDSDADITRAYALCEAAGWPS